MVAPETVFLCADTRLGRDVVVEPHVVFGPGVTVEEGAVIHAFSHLEGAHVGKNASVGPYARLRPGARLGTISAGRNSTNVAFGGPDGQTLYITSGVSGGFGLYQARLNVPGNPY